MNINDIYTTVFDEEQRLGKNPASSVEFITNKTYILKHLAPNSNILELGAGTRRYTLMLAEQGYAVTVLEYVDAHVTQLKNKVQPHHQVKCLQGDALDLSLFPDESFDMVLNMGPIYHTPDKNDQHTVIKESIRVLKKGGTLGVAFINNDMVFVTESLSYNPDFLTEPERYYDLSSHKIHGELFTSHTVGDIHQLMNTYPLKERMLIASDGYAELLADKINALRPEAFKCWMAFHLYTCEKPEPLNASHHLFYLAKKG